MRKTVVVLGKGDLAIKIAEWFHRSKDHDLVAVVPVTPEPAWSSSLTDWASDASVPIVESGRYTELPAGFGGKFADLGVSVFYDRIFKADGIARFGRLINLHNSPLPKYRGMSPINWALKNGERTHGFTIHEITSGIDDGPIIAQVLYSIFPDQDEVEHVYARALKFAWVLFQETIPLLDRIVAVPQEHENASYYSSKDSGLLGDRADWRRKPREAAE